MTDQIEDKKVTEEPPKEPPAPAVDPLLAIQQAKLATLEQEKEELARKMEELQTQNLEKSKNFQELYEREKAARAEAEAKSKQVAANYIEGLKQSGLKEEAARLGLKANYTKFLDSSDPLIQVETTSTGKVNILGTSLYVEKFKEEHPDCFVKKGDPVVNSNTGTAPMGNSDGLSILELMKLEKEHPDQYKVELEKKGFTQIR